MSDNNLPEGSLRTGRTLDGVLLRLEYSEARGYEIGGRLVWFARRIPSLEQAAAMFEAACFVEWREVEDVLRHAREEWKRLGSTSGWDTPAAKEWAIVGGALNRLEGKRPKVTRRGRLVEWV